jgi:hypothetical protein
MGRPNAFLSSPDQDERPGVARIMPKLAVLLGGRPTLKLVPQGQVPNRPEGLAGCPSGRWSQGTTLRDESPRCLLVGLVGDMAGTRSIRDVARAVASRPMC